MNKEQAAVKLRLAAFEFVRGGPVVDAKDSTGLARNRKLLRAAIRYAEAVKAGKR